MKRKQETMDTVETAEKPKQPKQNKEDERAHGWLMFDLCKRLII